MYAIRERVTYQWQVEDLHLGDAVRKVTRQQRVLLKIAAHTPANSCYNHSLYMKVLPFFSFPDAPQIYSVIIHPAILNYTPHHHIIFPLLRLCTTHLLPTS
jgi:hypothetical protein